MVKWSVLQPYAEKNSVDEVFTRLGRPINIRVVKTRRGNAIRIFYQGEDGEYHYHHIYEQNDPTLYKALKKVINQAKKGE